MIKYIDMQHLKYIFVALTIIAIIYIAYNINLLGNKIDALNTKVDGNWVGQDQRLNELSATSTLLTNAVNNIGAQIQQPWMVVPTEQGNMAVSPFLIQALQSEQANQMP